MSTVTWGGLPCIEPNSVLQACQDQQLPIDWYGKPNTWTTPLGHNSGRGWILLLRRDLDALGLDTPRDLVFSLDANEIAGISSPTRTVTHKNLHIVGATCLLPGVRGAWDSCFLVELADRRRLLRAIPIDAAYNLPATPGTADDYFTATKNGGSAWTWSTMATNIWNTIGASNLGAFPGLPTAPGGTPEGFSFYAWYALDALGVMLDRLGFALKLDTQTDTFSLVDLGAADPAAESVLSQYDGIRVFDDEVQTPSLGRYPAYVRVVFPKSLAAPDMTGSSPWHTVDVAATVEVTTANTYVLLNDDLPAIYDEGGNLTNGAEVSARAAERAADYYARLGIPRMRRIYGLPLAEFVPGSRIKTVRHGDRGRGMVTEVMYFPGVLSGSLALTPTEGGPTTTDAVVAGAGSGNEVTPWEPDGDPGPWLHGGSSSTTSQIWNTTWLANVIQQYISSGVWPITINTWLHLCAPIYQCQQTLTEWTTDQQDFVVPVGPPTLIITTDAPGYVLGGIVPDTLEGDPAPQTLTWVNQSDYPFVITHEDTNSTPANRIHTPNGVPLWVQPGNVVTTTYDTTLERWIIVDTTAPVETPPQEITTAVDLIDVVLDPPNTHLVQITPTAPGVTLESIVAPPSDVPGWFYITNDSPDYEITIVNQGTGDPGNLFQLPVDFVVIPPGDQLLVIRDPINNVFVVPNLAQVPPRVLELVVAAPVDDLDLPPWVNLLRLDVQTPTTLGGLVGTFVGQQIRLENVGTDTLELLYQDSGSSAANRLDNSTADDFDLDPEDSMDLFWNGSSWQDTNQIMAVTAAANGGTDELAKVSANDTTAGYLNGKLVAGTNITLTENSDGSNETLTIAASGGGTTGTYDETTLGSDYNFTNTGTWNDPSLTRTLPSAGTYLVMAEVSMRLSSATVSGSYASARLYNSSDLAAIVGTEHPIVTQGTSNTSTAFGAGSLAAIITVTGAKTIRVEAYTFGVASSTAHSADVLAESSIRYIKLA